MIRDNNCKETESVVTPFPLLECENLEPVLNRRIKYINMIEELQALAIGMLFTHNRITVRLYINHQ